MWLFKLAASLAKTDPGGIVTQTNVTDAISFISWLWGG